MSLSKKSNNGTSKREHLSCSVGFVKYLLASFAFMLLASCVGLKMSSSRLELQQSLVVNNYDKLKSVIVEEATNNGFSNLTEVKPSQNNNWEGRLNFITDSDVFKAEILRSGNNYSLYMHGGATSANLDSAIKGITQRVTELNKLNSAK